MLVERLHNNASYCLANGAIVCPPYEFVGYLGLDTQVIGLDDDPVALLTSLNFKPKPVNVSRLLLRNNTAIYYRLTRGEHPRHFIR